MRTRTCGTCGGYRSPLMIGGCPDCKGTGRVPWADEGQCGKPLERYGVSKECGRPAGHDGQCMTWSEYVLSVKDKNDDVIPAGD